MKSRLFSPAMIVACLALALSLGDTAYAVTRLPANRVGSRQVINHSLLRRDFRAGTLPITGIPLVKVATAFPAPEGGAETDAFILCPGGSVATGGGYLEEFSPDRDVVVLGSAPTFGLAATDNSHPDGWTLRLHQPRNQLHAGQVLRRVRQKLLVTFTDTRPAEAKGVSTR